MRKIKVKIHREIKGLIEFVKDPKSKKIVVLFVALFLLIPIICLILGRPTFSGKKFSASLSNDKNKVRTSFESQGGEVSFSFEGKNIKRHEKDGVVTFDVSDNTSIEYEFLNSDSNQGLKENIVLKNNKAPRSFRFDAELKGVERYMRDPVDYSWRFFNKDNKEMFHIPAGMMIDAKGVRSEGVNIEIAKEGDRYGVLVKANDMWLSDPKRAWPVKVDPSVIVSGGIDDTDTQFGSFQRKVVYANGNWYAFYSDGTDVFYKKSAGGVTWGPAVDVDTGDADNFSPTVWLQGNLIYVAWIDDSSDAIQVNTIDAGGSDSKGTACTSASQGTLDNTNTVSVAVADDGTVYFAYSDTGADTEAAVYKLVFSGCTFTDITTGSGLAAGDRPVLVAIGNNISMIFQDGDLSSSIYNGSSWTTSNYTISPATDNVYSATTDGTKIYLLSASGTTATNFYVYSNSSWLLAASPWSSETNIISVSLTYVSKTNQIYASIVKDSSEQVYWKKISVNDITTDGISFQALEQSSSSNTTTATTGTISPKANTMVYVFVRVVDNSAASASTVSGLNQTWTSVGNGTWSPQLFNEQRVDIYRAFVGPNPGSGQLTITSNVTANILSWSIIQVDGALTTGTNGANSVVQVSALNTGTGTTASTSLSAFGSTKNGALFFIGAQSGPNGTAEAGWTNLYDTNGSQGIYSRSDPDTTPTVSLDASVFWAGISFEIAAGPVVNKWSDETDFGFTSGDLSNMSSPLSVYLPSNMGVVVRQGSNFEFSGATTSTAPSIFWQLDEGTGNVASSSAESITPLNLYNFSSPPTGSSGWQMGNMCLQGNCLAFDGSNDHAMAANNNGSIGGSMSISVWVNPSALPTSGNIMNLVGKGSSGGEEPYYLRLKNNSGTQQIEVGTFTASADHNTVATKTLPTNTWTHLVGTFDGSNWNLYVNGQLASTTADSTGPVTTSLPVILGARNNAGAKDRFFNGREDEVKIYSYALSASQVASDYAARGSSFASSVLGASANMPDALSDGLVGYWTEDNLPPGIVQRKANYQANTTTLTITFDKPTTAKNNIVIVGYGYKSGTNWTPLNTEFTDSSGNTYERIDWWGGGDPAVTVMMTYTIAGGNDTITVDPTGTTGWNLGFVAYEISPIYKPQDLHPSDGTTGTDSVNSGNPTPGSVTPTQGGDLALVVMTPTTGGASVTSISSPTGFTSDLNQTGQAQNGNVSSMLLGENDTSALNPAWTASPSQAYAAMIALFKSAYGPSDSSGNSNTIQDGGAGALLASGQFGNAIDLESTSSQYQYAADSTSLSITGSLTLSAWIKPESTSDTQNDVLGKWDSSSNESYLLAQRGQKVRLYLDSSSNYIETNSNVLTAGSWAHVAGVYDSTNRTAQIYINGAKVATTITGTIPASIGDDSGRFHIGAEQSSGTAVNFFDGLIDDARVYARNLSDMEISNLYSWAAGPIAQYNFEEGYGQVVNDTSTYGNNGGFNQGSGSRPTWTSGKFGKGLRVNAPSNDNYVGVTDRLGIDVTYQSLTMEGWIYRNGVGDGNETLYKKDRNYILRYLPGSSLVEAIVWSTTTKYIFQVSSSLALNKWYHIAFVWDQNSPGSSTFYINGVATTDTDGGSAEIALYTNNLSIGGSGNEDLNGTMDQFQIYNYARSAKQIVSDMNAGHPPVGSPVSSPLVYLKLDDGFGNVASSSGSMGAIGNGLLTAMANPATVGSGWNQNGKYNRALAFDGVDDYVGINGSTGINFGDVSFSISVWFNTKTTVTDAPIIDNYNNSTPYMDLSINASRQLEWSTRDSNSQTVFVDSPNAVNDGKWHHAVVNRDTDNNTYNMYLDGRLVATTADTRTGNYIATNNSNKYYLGWDRTLFYSGLIDEVKIYNYALTPDQVKVDYNRQSNLVLGALSDTSQLSGGSVASNSASAEYCVPGDSTSCVAPVLRWDFEQAKTSTIVPDVSGNGNDGTMNNNPVPVSGKPGRALQFNSSGTTYVRSSTVNSLPTIQGAKSISFWMYPTVGSLSGNRTAVSLDNNSNAAIELGFRSGAFLAWKWGGTTLVTTTAPTLNQWHFVEYTTDGSNNHSIYIDGVLRQTTSTVSDTGSPSKFDVGGFGTSEVFQGSIDQVRIFNYQRTPAQIAWDYNQGDPSGYWKLDECQGTTLYDSSGNGSTGTKNGSTTTGTCTTASSWWGGASGTSTTNAGKYNYAPSFDGSTDYVSIPTRDALQGTNGITLSMWAKADAFGGNRSPGGLFGSSSDKGYWMNIQDQGEPQFWISRDGSAQDDAPNTTVKMTVGRWHHLVGTYDGSTIKVYMDGQLIGSRSSVTGTIHTVTTANAFAIARLGALSSDYFDGKVDDVRVYNYPATAAQVKTIYNQGSAVRFGPITGTP